VSSAKRELRSARMPRETSRFEYVGLQGTLTQPIETERLPQRPDQREIRSDVEDASDSIFEDTLAIFLLERTQRAYCATGDSCGRCSDARTFERGR
jgi:hypothetical protein